jgi:hypothetical protein
MQRFPAALVWGQPGAKEGGGVTAASVLSDDQSGAEEVAAGRGKSRRKRKSNVRVIEPEWVSP